MPRFDVKQISTKEKEQLLNEFFMAVAVLESYEEVAGFFKDLLSYSETIMLARRLQIAKMFLQGYNCDEIRNIMKAGMDTINSVRSWLEYGRAGYIKAIEYLEKYEKQVKKQKRKKEALSDSFSWQSFKRRYMAYHWPEELLPEIEKMIKNYFRRQKRRKSVKKKIK